MPPAQPNPRHTKRSFLLHKPPDFQSCCRSVNVDGLLHIPESRAVAFQVVPGPRISPRRFNLHLIAKPKAAPHTDGIISVSLLRECIPCRPSIPLYLFSLADPS